MLRRETGWVGAVEVRCSKTYGCHKGPPGRGRRRARPRSKAGAWLEGGRSRPESSRPEAGPVVRAAEVMSWGQDGSEPGFPAGDRAAHRSEDREDQADDQQDVADVVVDARPGRLSLAVDRYAVIPATLGCAVGIGDEVVGNPHDQGTPEVQAEDPP